MTKKLTLGLFGFGCVGQGLHRVLEETEGLETEIRRICIKHPEKSRSLPAGLFTTSPKDLLDDPDIDVIVELIDDADAAWQIVTEALRKGKHVVTANKRMVATHLDEIRSLQKLTDRSVLYEGAVCGSIPIIRNLEEYYDNDRINRIEGIVNGSTNYILTRVAEEGTSYATALSEAQRLGFAESDPRLDVQAFDASFKLSILLTHAFGIRVKPEEIIRVGIDRLSDYDLAYARESNLRVKLIAGGYRLGNGVVGWVAPKLVAPGEPLHGIQGVFNAVCVEGLFAEEQLFVGKGAGGSPTGSAVLSDISALAYHYRYAFRKAEKATLPGFSQDATVAVRVGCPPGTRISPLDFVHFSGGLRTRNWHQLEGEISLEVFAEWARRDDLSLLLPPGANPKPWKQVKQHEMEAA